MSKIRIDLGELMTIISRAYKLQDDTDKIIKSLESIIKKVKVDD